MEEITLPLFADDLTVYAEYPKELIKTKIARTALIARLQDTRLIYSNLLLFYMPAMNNWNLKSRNSKEICMAPKELKLELGWVRERSRWRLEVDHDEGPYEEVGFYYEWFKEPLEDLSKEGILPVVPSPPIPHHTHTNCSLIQFLFVNSGFSDLQLK